MSSPQRMPRWHFLDIDDASPVSDRQNLEQRIDLWWHAFAQQSPRIHALFDGSEQWDLAQWMIEQLGQIGPHLMWEFGPGISREPHRLVITAEGRREFSPLVHEIVRRAPNGLGFEFYPLRLASDFETALHTPEARGLGALLLTGVRASIGKGRRIDLHFEVQRGARTELAEQQGLVFAEAILGEEVFNQWIGWIDCTEASAGGLLNRFRRRPTAAFRPIQELREAVAQLVDRVHGSIPTEPFLDWVEERSWSVLKLEPEHAVDYAAQDDLFVYKTPEIALFEATRRPGFSTVRFSRHGECFAYLKIDGSNASEVEREAFADKSELEDSIDHLLLHERLGCQIGGGTGLRYSYVELALLDAQAAMPLLLDFLRQSRVPQRSWLLFHEPEMELEWLGIYPETPPPPTSTNS